MGTVYVKASRRAKAYYRKTKSALTKSARLLGKKGGSHHFNRTMRLNNLNVKAAHARLRDTYNKAARRLDYGNISPKRRREYSTLLTKLLKKMSKT